MTAGSDLEGHGAGGTQAACGPGMSQVGPKAGSLNAGATPSGSRRRGDLKMCRIKGQAQVDHDDAATETCTAAR